jgi:GNAT superfamily N-acetyltransferase
MTTRSSPQIRPAGHADVPEILAMVRELAEFEHLLHEAVATEDGLSDALFGPRPYAEVLIARVGDDVAGFALFFHNYSTFVGKPGLYLEDLYIRPAYRGQGCGKALLTRVAQLAVARGCGRFEWSVLDWNQRAIDFYHSIGARPMSDWTMMRVSGEALAKLGAAGG